MIVTFDVVLFRERFDSLLQKSCGAFLAILEILVTQTTESKRRRAGSNDMKRLCG
jgi:hypothetical protein